MPRQTQGELISQQLEKVGLTPAEFAEELGTTKSHVSKIINGHQHIPVNRVPKAAEVLKVDADVLYILADQLPPDIRPIIIAYPKLIRTIRNHHRVMMIQAAENPLYRRDIAGTMDGTNA